MKGFKIDASGDVVIGVSDIETVEDNELKAQKIQTVLGTNKGEWPLNKKEGIVFSQILGKGVTEDMVRTQVQDGIKQVDAAAYIDKFDFSADNRHRTAKVSFTAKSSNSGAIDVVQNWE
jgi:hypothetical protein